MKAESGSRRSARVVHAVVAICVVSLSAASASAQLLYSFENGLDDFTSATATLANSTTLGVTHGAQSLLIDNLDATPPNSFKFAGTVTESAGSGTQYTTWGNAGTAIAAGKKSVKLEFDFSWDHTLVTNAVPAFAQLGLFVNSNGPGYLQYGTGDLIGGNIGGGSTSFPTLAAAAINDGVTMTSLGLNSVHFAIPLGPTKHLHIGPENGNFYQMGFQSNGGWTGTADWAIDNVRITGAVPPTTSETLFSWETPDDSGTTGVDERFEGWLPGNFVGHPPHVHTITTTGATDGTHALQIERTNMLPPAGSDPEFTWGSFYTLNSDTNPDPMVETIDPVIQAKIDSLITKVEAADRVAFDVTYKFVDHFPDPVPGYTDFSVFFADEAGAHQYQATGPGIAVTSMTQQTSTIQIPLTSFVDATNNMLTLKNDGFVADSNFFRIAIGSSTDANQIYQIDNFRLLTDILAYGDYNDDGLVDAADYVVWRENVGTTNTLPNDAIHGTIGQGQYDQWKANFGKSLGSGSGSSSALGSAAVPEPTSAALAFTLMMAGLLTFRRGV